MTETELNIRIRDARMEHGLTRKQLAEASGLSERAIRHYEEDSASPTSNGIIALAKGLGIPPEELTGEPVPTVSNLKYGSITYKLAAGDWKKKTVEEIAEEFGCTPQAVHSGISVLGKRGCRIKYRQVRAEKPKTMPDEPIKFTSMIINDRIETARLARGLTRKEVSEATGISVSGLERIEIGRTMPREGFIAKFAKLCGIEPEELAGGPVLAQYPDLQHGSPRWKLLSRDWNGVPLDVVAKKIDMSENFVKSEASRIKKLYGVEISFRRNRKETIKQQCAYCHYWTRQDQSNACCVYLLATGQRRPRGADGECLGYRQKDKR